MVTTQVTWETIVPGLKDPSAYRDELLALSDQLCDTSGDYLAVVQHVVTEVRAIAENIGLFRVTAPIIDGFQPRTDTPKDPENGLEEDYIIGHFNWKCPPDCGVEHTRDMEQSGPGTDERIDTCPWCGRTYRLRATFTVEIKEASGGTSQG